MRAVAERIDALVRDFAASPDPAARQNAQELVRLLMRLYGAGLARIVHVLELDGRDAEGPAGRIMATLLADDLIASLLVLHDLHPEDVETRIARGLERLQEAAGAEITVLEVGDGAARVKVGARSRAPATSLLDLQRLIDDVVHAVAPDIVRVDVEGLPPKASPPLIQLTRNPLAEPASALPIP